MSDFVAADITKDRAANIISALYTCGNTLAGLLPETRLIVLRALCVTFLEEKTDAPEHSGAANSTIKSKGSE